MILSHRQKHTDIGKDIILHNLHLFIVLVLINSHFGGVTNK